MSWKATSISNGGTTTGFDPAPVVPSLALEGDRMTVVVQTSDNNPDISPTPPATETWTLEASASMPIDGTGATSPAAVWIYGKDVSADDETNAGTKTYTWTFSGSEEQCAVLVLTDPATFGQFAKNELSGNRTTIDAPTVTTSVANEDVYHCALKDNGVAFDSMPSGDATVAHEIWGATNGAGAALGIVREEYALADTVTGTKAFPHPSDESNGYTFSLEPVATDEIIDANVVAITLSTQNADLNEAVYSNTVSLSVAAQNALLNEAISSNTVPLSILTQNANLNETIFGNTVALSLTTQNALLNEAISSNTVSLTISTKNVTVNLNISVTANVLPLFLSAKNANLNESIIAEKVPINLLARNAVLNEAIVANRVPINLLPQNANLDESIFSNTVSLTLSAQEINVDETIFANVVPLSITGLSANAVIIDRIFANVVPLSLSTKNTFIDEAIVANTVSISINTQNANALVPIVPNRVCLVNLLIDGFKRINGGTDITVNAPSSPYTFYHDISNNVFRTFKYIDELDDYPVICFVISEETRVHIGDGNKFGLMTFIIRGYVYSDDDSVNDTDDLIDDIEYIVETLNFQPHCDCDLVNARVVAVESDEGLFSPYGLAQLEVQMSYRLPIGV